MNQTKGGGNATEAPELEAVDPEQYGRRRDGSREVAAGDIWASSPRNDGFTGEAKSAATSAGNGEQDGGGEAYQQNTPRPHDLRSASSSTNCQKAQPAVLTRPFRPNLVVTWEHVDSCIRRPAVVGNLENTLKTHEIANVARCSKRSIKAIRSLLVMINHASYA